MKILYFDCFAGISGDMTLGAFLDIGVDPEFLKSELNKLGVPGFHLEIEKTQKRSITGTQCHVIMDRHEHCHRHYSDIVKIIEDSTLSDAVKKTAIAIFGRVAEAEGKVHGVPMDHVHFHEVGAVDSIVDIVGASICFHALAPDKVYGSAVNVGCGFVKCAHGLLPVPAPATAEIIGQSNFEVYTKGIDGESATPTGMAILTELAEYTHSFPQMKIDRLGYGFGDREFEILNGLRFFLGNTEEEETVPIVEIETNIDDMTGENAGYVLEGLFAMGVNDVFYTPIYMKKNRPAMKLTVICEETKRVAVENYLFKETSTIGLRYYPVKRTIMDRKEELLETAFGPIRMKCCRIGDIEKRSPEYEDVKRIALETGKSFLEINHLVYKKD
ncbi:MAG: nickel pincer cofactor biosynthesis protein LarC [Eubacterium sp.]